MLRYKFPSCISIRILTIRMSGPASGACLDGAFPQETERRWVLEMLLDVITEVGVGSLGGEDDSTSRQETEGDFTC